MRYNYPRRATGISRLGGCVVRVAPKLIVSGTRSDRGSNVVRNPVRRILAVAAAAALTSIAVPLALSATTAGAAPGDPVVTLQSGTAGCEGVRPTPGSENTNKRLVSGDLEPGGTVTFEISYPVSASDVAGRTTFTITDCVFINDTAALKYTVDFVPNTENFLLTFSLTIPPGTPIGAQYCNDAKTTAAPSDSPASNRKAGPACFFVGGDLRIIKEAAGDSTHTPLTGATFDVACHTGTATIPPVVISGLSGSTSFDAGSGDYVASGTADTGVIAIAGPEGTPCTVTETAPPAGFDLPADPVFHYTIPAATAGQEIDFIDDPLHKNTPTIVTDATSGTVGDAISDTATLSGATDDASGTITFSLFGPSNTPDCSGDPIFTDSVDVSGNGDYKSVTFTPELNGNFYWIAAYSGDAENDRATGTCGDDGETSNLKPSPSPTTASSTPTTPTPSPTHSQQPVAVTGGPVDGQIGWALALLALGGSLAFGAKQRYRRQH